MQGQPRGSRTGRELLAFIILLIQRMPRAYLARRGRAKWWWLLAGEYHGHRRRPIRWKTCAEVMRQQPPLLFAVLIPQQVGSWWRSLETWATGVVRKASPELSRENALPDTESLGDPQRAGEGHAGQRRREGWPVPTWRPGIWIGIFLLVPLLIVDLGIHSWRFSAETGWLVLVNLETAALLTLPALVWEEIIGATATIDDLLDDRDNAKVAEWLDRRLVPIGHLAFCLLGSAVGIGGSLLTSRYVQPSFTVPYYIAVGVLGFLAADVVRWVWRAPLVLRYLAAECPGLRINKLVPADTRSVRQMSYLVETASLYAAVGIAIFAAPLLWMVLHSGKHRGALAAWSGAPMLVALATATYLTFLPQAWITRMLEQHQIEVLETIAKAPFIDGRIERPADDLDKEVALYRTFAAGATATPEATAVTRKAAKVLLAVAPYAAAIVVKLLRLNVG